MSSTATTPPFEPSPPRRGWTRGRPNVVVIVLDDLGFGQVGCFGSSLETPNLDALAGAGLRFTNFHTTALCAPTRASLMTGRNHHRVGMGWHPDLPMRFPGYHGRIPREAATMAEVLQEHGWATWAIGKWHLTPTDERSPVGPFTHWPTQKGFDRFYGFLGGDTNQFAPMLTSDQAFVEPPTRPEDGYHLNVDLADTAIERIRELRAYQPSRPFFLYYATGAVHAPHHAPQEWIDKFAGRFDAGWDAWREETLERQKRLGIVPPDTVLSPRPSWVDAWDSLSADEQRFCARTMEVFAGFLAHTDHEIGRVITAIDELGELDDTVVVVMSDNGASGQGGVHGSLNELRFICEIPENFEDDLARIDDLGGPRSYNHYAWGWALAGNTPLQRWKKYTWEGGTRCPLILRAPGVTDPGGVRTQYAHVIDLYPTILARCGIDPPAVVKGVTQMPLDGRDFATVIEDAAAPEVRITQYFELEGSRAIYHDGWKAVTNHVYQGQLAERELVEGSHEIATDRWTLIDTRHDFAEIDDLAGTHPDKVRELERLWWHEAGRHGVLPITDHNARRGPYADIRWTEPTTSVTLRAGGRHWLANVPSLHRTPFRITAALDGPLADGVLAEVGDWNGGWALIARDGQVAWLLNLAGTLVAHGATAVTPGVREVAVTFEPADVGGTLTFLLDGHPADRLPVPVDLPRFWNVSGAFLTAGHGTGLPVSDRYENPWPYAGALRHLTVAAGAAPAETDHRVRAMHRTD